MRRHGAAARLDQLRPSLRVPLFVLRQFFKNRRPLIVLLGRGHGTVQGDSVHLDDIILPKTGNVRCGGL